ncbi:MAG: GNAT family N-acetyltransferase [Acidimicrobiales bacterium]
MAPDGTQVGLTRVPTDGATFGWVCDVSVLGDHRGNGLGKAMLGAVLEHPDVAPVRRLLSATADAHRLYRQHGLTSLDHPDRWMERRSPAFDLPG